MISPYIDLTAFDRNTGTGRIELSSQGSSGHDAPFGVSNYATDEVLFNFLVLVIACYFLLLFFLLFLLIEIFIAFVW